jgi:hypothetical protein
MLPQEQIERRSAALLCAPHHEVNEHISIAREPQITRRSSVANEGETADNADAANHEQTKETWRSKPQIDTDETQIGKECFFDL